MTHYVQGKVPIVIWTIHNLYVLSLVLQPPPPPTPHNENLLHAFPALVQVAIYTLKPDIILIIS